MNHGYYSLFAYHMVPVPGGPPPLVRREDRCAGLRILKGTAVISVLETKTGIFRVYATARGRAIAAANFQRSGWRVQVCWRDAQGFGLEVCKDPVPLTVPRPLDVVAKGGSHATV